MKNCIVIIFFLVTSGCAYVTKDTTMEVLDQNQWSMKKYRAHSALEYSCSDTKKVAINFDNTLAIDGKTYLMFFIIPVGSADLFDKPYSGINVETTYPEGYSSCIKGNIYLKDKNNKHKPFSSIQDKSQCRHKWNLPINKEGSFSLILKGIDNCNIPTLNFKYETETNYHYDKLQG